MSAFDSAPEAMVEPRPSPTQPAAAPHQPHQGPDRMDPLNLARRPFLNSRPVVRVSLLLWLLGLALLLGNVSLFWSYLSGSADKRAQIGRGEQEIQRQQRAVQQLQSRLDGLDLGGLNERIDFLNERIEERTFSWSLLLDRLVAVLPNDIRLSRLQPKTDSKAQLAAGRSRRSRSATAGQIPLAITGETRSDEALLRFVDNLFAHPAFAEPDLLREERQDNDLVRFELTVQYIPGRPPGSAVEETPRLEEAPSGSSAPAGPPAASETANPSGGQP
jgi:Tfp pilus assembly protein PilN